MREVKALCTSLRKHSFLLALTPRDVSRETSSAAKSEEKRMLSRAICVPSVSFSSQIQLVIILNCRVHLLDCEQSLFFFRFTEECTRARALSDKTARRVEKRRRRLQSRAWSFSCHVRFARRTKKKETARSLCIF